MRGISFKLQEEERERKDQYVPSVSALDRSNEPLEVDPDTKDLLRQIGFEHIPVAVANPMIAEVADRPYRSRRDA